MNGWSEQAGGPHAASPVLRPAACRARLDGVDTGARCDSGLPSRLARQRVSPRRSAAACTREHGAPGSTATSASGRNPRVEVPSRGSPRPAARHSKPDSSVLKRPSRNIGPAGSGIENGGPANSMHCPIAGNRRAGQKNRRAIKRTTWPITDQIRIQRSMPLRDLGQIRKQWRCPARVSNEPAIAPAHRGAARDPSAAAFAASVEIARAGMASGRRTPFWRKQRYFIHAGPSAARFDCRPNEKAVSEMSSTRIRRPCALALSASRLADQNRQMALSRLIGAPPLFRYRGRTRPRCPHRMRNGTPKAPRRYAPCSAKGERFRESR